MRDVSGKLGRGYGENCKFLWRLLEIICVCVGKAVYLQAERLV